MSIAEASVEHGPPQNSLTAGRKKYGPLYSGWSGKTMYGCFCDFGWKGTKCQFKMCPKGDDPRTTGQSDTVIQIVTSGTAGTQLQGFFTFHFLGFQAQLRANSLLDASGSSDTFTDANCISFITSLSNVDTATCVVSGRDSNTGGATYTITFTKYPVHPLENGFFSHTGAPSVNDMGCSQDDITAGNSPTCVISVTTSGTKEYATCSNRGNCEEVGGLCKCHDFFHGIACEQEGVFDQQVHNRVALLLDATSNSYTGDLLKTFTKKAPATDFNLITMTAGGESVRFQIDGTNNVKRAGGIAASTGITVLDGGLVVERSTADLDVMSVFSTSASMTNDVLELHTSNTNAGTGFNFLQYSAAKVEKLNITGTGQIDSDCDLNPTSETEGCLITAGGIGIPGNVYGQGIVVSKATTDSTSKTTGSIITPGGVGIGKRAAMGSFELVNSDQYTTTTSPGHIYNEASGYYIWTITLTSSHGLTKSINTAISQESSLKDFTSPEGFHGTITGILQIALTGSGTSIIFAAAAGQTFLTSNDLTVGGSVISNSIISATSKVLWAYLYTITISSTTINEAAGTKVTQGTNEGILRYALSGSVTTIKIVALTDQMLWPITGTDLVVGGTTVAHSAIQAVVNNGAQYDFGSYGGTLAMVEVSDPLAKSTYNLIKCNIDKDRVSITEMFKVDGTGFVSIPSGLNLGGIRDSGERGGLTVDAGGWTIAGGNFAMNQHIYFNSNSASQSIEHTGANTGAHTTGAAPLTISTHSSAKIKIVGKADGVLTIGNRDGGTNIYSGSLGLKTANPIRFDGSTEDSYWLTLSLAGDPTASHTLTMPVIYDAGVLTDVSVGSSSLNSLGTLVGLEVTSTEALSTTTGVVLTKNSLASNFVGNLVQLDSAMPSGSSNFNFILSRSDSTGAPATMFKVDGTGAMTAAGSGSTITTGGINMYTGNFLLTGSGPQAITHTGSANNGLTISSSVRTTIGGNSQVHLGSPTVSQTFIGNHPIQFDGDTVDGNFLILNVGDGPIGSSKTLTLPIDSDATVVASASTLAVQIQTSHSDGVTVESAKIVDNIITEKTDSTYLSIETVRIEDAAISQITTLSMSSHLTNAGGDILLTGSADQDITKSGGGDLIISSSHNVGTVYTHLESWKFSASTVDSTGTDLSMNGLTTAMENFQCTEENCFFKDSIYTWAINIDISGWPHSIAPQSAGVAFTQNQASGPTVTGVLHTSIGGYESWTFTLGSDHGLTKTVGDAVTQGALSGLLQVALTGSGTSIVITAETGNSFNSNVDLVVGGATIAHANINSVASVRWGYLYTITISSTTINEVEGKIVSQGANVGVLRVALSGSVTTVKVVGVSGMTWVTNANLVIGGTTVAHSAILSVSSNGAFDYAQIVVTIFTGTGVYKDLTLTDNCNIGTFLLLYSFMNSVVKTRLSKTYTLTIPSTAITAAVGATVVHGDASGVLRVALTGTGMTSVVVACAASVTFSTAIPILVGGVSVSVTSINSPTITDYLIVETVDILDGAVGSITPITILSMSSHLTNTGSDLLLTKSGNQLITKSGGGDLIISASHNSGTVYTIVEDLKFNGADVTSSGHLTVDAASTTVEKFKCVANVCENTDGSTNYIQIEDIQFLNGATSAITTQEMSSDLTNSGGDILLTKSGNQLITKSGTGDLLISGGAAVCVEDWCVTAGAAAISSNDVTIDALSVTIEDVAIIDYHLDNSGSSFISIEVAKMQDQAVSAVTDLTLTSDSTHFGTYYTIFLVPNAITESAGVFVTQGSNRGILVNSLSGSTINTYTIVSIAGLTWSPSTDIVIDDTTPAKTIYTVTMSVEQTFDEAKGVTVTQGGLSGTLNAGISSFGGPTTSFKIYANKGLSWSTSSAITVGSTVVQNIVYTVSVNSQSVTSLSAGVAVTQSGRSGTLKESISGTITSFKIIATSGLTWSTGENIVIGGVSIAHATINTVSASTLAYTSITASNVITDIQVSTSTRVGHMYTVQLSTATSFNEVAGVEVAQGTLKAVLKTAVSGSVLFFEILSIQHLSWLTGSDIVVGSTTIPNSVISNIVVSGALTVGGGDLTFSGSSDQDITKSASGDLIISGPNEVIVESWEFNAAALTDLGTTALSMDGTSAGAEKFQCAVKDCYHFDGANNYIQLENIEFLNGAMSQVITMSLTGDLTNSGGDLLLTKSGNQLLTNSNSGDLSITNSASGGIEVSKWRFINDAVASPSSDISIDANTVRIENLKLDGSTLFNLDNSNALSGTNAITLEEVDILNSAQSGKSISLDPNDVDSAVAITVTNTASQSSGALVSITGESTSDLSILALKSTNGNVLIGDNPFKIELAESGITRFAIETSTSTFGAGYQSWTFTLAVDHGLTKAVGVAVTQGSVSGKLQTALTGSGTEIVVTADAGQMFVQDVALVVGGTSVNKVIYTVSINSQSISKSAGDAISQASNSGTLLEALSGSVTQFKIVAASGLTWDTGADITIGGTTIAHATINSVSSSSLQYHVGHQIVTFTTTQDHGLTKSVGSAITQGTMTGKLLTALTGSGTTIVIEATIGQLFSTIVDLDIGGSTIANQYISTVGSVFRDSDTWNNKYTMTITATTINEAVGVQVKQGTNVGVLQTALSGSVSSVVIIGPPGITWTTAGTNLDVGGTTIPHASLQAVVDNGIVGGSVTLNSVSGSFVYSGCNVDPGKCSAEHTFNNNKISSVNTVVMMTIAGFSSLNGGGMTAFNNPSSDGIPHLATGTVSTGNMKFWICNYHPTQKIAGNIKLNYIILSA
jgi:hypothetical protein